MEKPSQSSPWHPASRELERENKREAVLRTAARLFSERGFHETSLELVADELAITRPTVYYYFKSKDEILFECVRIALEMIERAAQEVAGRGGSAADELVAVMHKYAEIIMMDFGMCLVRVGEDPLPPESRRKLRKLQSNIDTRIRTLIKRGIQEKSFSGIDPKLAGFAVAGALNSIARWYDPAGPLTSREIAIEFAGMLTRSLGARRRTGAKPKAVNR